MKIELEVTQGPHAGRKFSFGSHEMFLVGRSPDAHFRLSEDDQFFSRMHFMIEVNPPRCRLTDLDSTNGTYVNGKPVSAVDLTNGDVITGGTTTIEVTIHSVDETEEFEDPFGETHGDLEPWMPSDAYAADPTSPKATREFQLGLNENDASNSFAIPDGPSDRSTQRVRRICPTCDPDDARIPTADTHEFEGVLCEVCTTLARGQRQHVDGYAVVRKLGNGAMGDVWLAARLADARPVAIKTIRTGSEATPDDVKRLLREARTLHSLDHPSIVAFHEMGESQGHIYFSMDYVRGTDARELLRQYPEGVPVHVAVNLVCEILPALDYAHAKGWIHRDIKPANILVPLEETKPAQLVDFGLAYVYQSSRLSGMSMEQGIGGTIAFMAPEQLTEFRTPRVAGDLYSVGATLYNLLTNQYVYDFPAGLQQAILTILQQDPVPIRARRPDLPVELTAIVDRTLARSPDDRWPDAIALRRALKPFAE